jgi:hypothetical protein
MLDKSYPKNKKYHNILLACCYNVISETFVENQYHSTFAKVSPSSSSSWAELSIISVFPATDLDKKGNSWKLAKLGF